MVESARSVQFVDFLNCYCFVCWFVIKKLTLIIMYRTKKIILLSNFLSFKSVFMTNKPKSL